MSRLTSSKILLIALFAIATLVNAKDRPTILAESQTQNTIAKQNAVSGDDSFSQNSLEKSEQNKEIQFSKSKKIKKAKIKKQHKHRFFSLDLSFRKLKKIREKNMGLVDRIVRIAIAGTLAALFFTNTLTGALGIIGLVVAGIFLVTSFIGTCPIYCLLGFKTCPVKKTKNKDGKD